MTDNDKPDHLDAAKAAIDAAIADLETLKARIEALRAAIRELVDLVPEWMKDETPST
jgi:hypothetical protein